MQRVEMKEEAERKQSVDDSFDYQHSELAQNEADCMRDARPCPHGKAGFL